MCASIFFKSIYLFCQKSVCAHNHRRTDGCTQHNTTGRQQINTSWRWCQSSPPLTFSLLPSVCSRPRRRCQNISLVTLIGVWGMKTSTFQKRRKCWRACQNNGDFVRIITSTKPYAYPPSCQSPTPTGSHSAGHVSIHWNPQALLLENERICREELFFLDCGLNLKDQLKKQQLGT